MLLLLRWAEKSSFGSRLAWFASQLQGSRSSLSPSNLLSAQLLAEWRAMNQAYGGTFAQSRIHRPDGKGTNIDLSVNEAFAGQPDLMCMIEVAQKSRGASLVRALHEQFRVLLCASAGLAPGDKEWTELVKQITASIGKAGG